MATTTFTRIGQAQDIFPGIVRHIEANRADMGDAWAEELLAFHRNAAVELVNEYMATVTAQGEVRERIQANLLRPFGL